MRGRSIRVREVGLSCRKKCTPFIIPAVATPGQKLRLTPPPDLGIGKSLGSTTDFPKTPERSRPSRTFWTGGP